MMSTWTAEKIEALRTAQESKSYKDTYGTFEAYCKAVHGISIRRAYVILSGERGHKVPISAELRWRIWERDDFRCAYCGKRQFLSVDHIKPERFGGTLDESNLITACMKCNLKRNADGRATALAKSRLTSGRLADIVERCLSTQG